MTELCAEDLSDEDVFFGKMTLKEVKKHIWLNHGKNRASSVVKQEPVDCNRSIQIIESHSQPNLRNSPLNNTLTPSLVRDNRKSEENLANIENLVSKVSVSPKKAELAELNNTFEMIEYILNNGPQLDTQKNESENTKPNNQQNVNKEIETLKTNILAKFTPKKEIKLEETPIKKYSPRKESVPNTAKSPLKKTKMEPKTPKTSPVDTPAKSTKNDIKNESAKPWKASPKQTPNLASPKYLTPCKSPRKEEDIFQTPSTDLLKFKTPIFKTPANPLSTKKQSATSLKFTPSKSPMFKHIQSPIATYIKGSVEVPMISNVCPKKPLPGSSMIPKLVKSTTVNKPGNKENVNIPTTVFKSAKKTKVVHVPVTEKPQSQSAKKLLAKMPQPPVILKHQAREFSHARRPLINLQEDSIADLSCAQADVSVCTLVKPCKKL